MLCGRIQGHREQVPGGVGPIGPCPTTTTIGNFVVFRYHHYRLLCSMYKTTGLYCYVCRIVQLIISFHQAVGYEGEEGQGCCDGVSLSTHKVVGRLR